MPFRKNYFNEQIAQPGTTWSEIDDVLLNRNVAAASIYSADIFTNGDDQFKFGGVLYVSGEDLEGVGEQIESEVSFDGFATLEDAKAWVTGLDLVSFDINEVN